jgi:hypothetical protein
MDNWQRILCEDWPENKKLRLVIHWNLSFRLIYRLLYGFTENDEKISLKNGILNM